MGQYGNQPDFGTKAIGIVPEGNWNTDHANLFNLKSAALYIGTGGTLICQVVGGNDDYVSGRNYTIFKNIPDGTFFPVIVNYVYADNDDAETTTCADIVVLY